MRCLTKGELKTYETLIHQGPLSVVKLAKETKLYRTSLYQVIANLVDKGLVIKDNSTILAVHPTILKEKINEEFIQDNSYLANFEKLYLQTHLSKS